MMRSGSCIRHSPVVIHAVFELQRHCPGPCSGGTLSRVTILAEWLRYFNDLAVGETAAPACFLRENAEGAGMPPLPSH